MAKLLNGTTIYGSANVNSTLYINGSGTTALQIPGSANLSSYNAGLLQLGQPLTFSDIDIMASIVMSVNSYSQMIVQNSYTGSNASCDIVVNNDSPSGTLIYGDFGINSTIYSGLGAFSAANGTYLYASGGSLSIGTSSNTDFNLAINSNTIINANGLTNNVNVSANVIITGNNYIALSTGIGQVANGTTNTTAYKISRGITEFTLANNKGAILPVAAAPGQIVFIANDDTGNNLTLYPPSGGVIDQAPLNTGVTINPGGMWMGAALTTLNWTSITPDLTSTNNQITVTQGNAVVTFAMANTFITPGTMNVNNTTASTSNTTGALVVAGGVGVSGVINTSNYIYSTNGGIGYPSGAGVGSTITQSTNRTTGVTLNNLSGRITLTSQAMSSGTSNTFTLTNSKIAANDFILLNHWSGGTIGNYNFSSNNIAGSANVTIRAVSTVAAEAPVIQFMVLKSAAT